MLKMSLIYNMGREPILEELLQLGDLILLNKTLYDLNRYDLNQLIYISLRPRRSNFRSSHG